MSRIDDNGALVSRVFLVDGDNLAFIAFDFGGEATRVDLSVGDEVVRRFSGRDSRSLVSVRWNVAPLRGREAVLSVVDQDQRAEKWIGIDEIALFDEGGE